MGGLQASYPSVDEFGDAQGRVDNLRRPGTGFTSLGAPAANMLSASSSSHIQSANKTIRSSRARKKTAARSKGGEFQARRRKRRLYFCCIASEIDVENLAERFQDSYLGMKGQMYDEVLHLHMSSVEELGIPIHELPCNLGMQRAHSLGVDDEKNRMFGIAETDNENEHPEEKQRHDRHSGRQTNYDSEPERQDRKYNLDPFNHYSANPDFLRIPSFDDRINPLHIQDNVPTEDEVIKAIQSSSVFWNYGGKEVFIFDFGAIVFWGYQRSEVSDLLQLAREYVLKGKLSDAEFEVGEDDMAFVTAIDSDVNTITIANDVIVLPDSTSVQSRLAVSFAIAQSSVLSIFEARIEEKIEEYKYIPEVLAKSGKVQLTAKELGNMIGEVFVIRHDVNLHSEILDIPDYFWKQYAVEPLYRMTAMYLEMEPRTEVLNKRLDLLRELLRLLQHQHENGHNVKLEWIVIWLIVISAALELLAMIGGLWDGALAD